MSPNREDDKDQDKDADTPERPVAASDADKAAADQPQGGTGAAPEQATPPEGIAAETGGPVAPTPETRQAEAEPRPEPEPEPEPEPATAAPAGAEPARERGGIGAGGAFFMGLIATILVLAALAAAAWVTLPAWQTRVATLFAGGGEERIGTVENRAARVAEQVTAMAGRVDQLERNVAELRDAVRQIGQQAPAAAGGPSVDPARVDALAQRVAALETLDRVDPARVAALGDAVEQLNGQIAELQDQIGQTRDQIAQVEKASADAATVLRLADRIEAAESAVRQAESRTQAAQALLMTVGQLREAVFNGQSFDEELRAVKAVAPDDADVARSLQALQPLAAKGVATRTALAARFGELAPDIVRADFGPEAEGWLRQTIQRLTSVVTVRRTEGDVAGESVAAIVARAEAALDQGDLAGAVNELSALQGPAAETAAPWLNAAKARLAAETALSDLSAHAVAVTEARG